MNISLISNTVLKQPSKKLVLSDITRFMIFDSVENYFCELGFLKLGRTTKYPYKRNGS